MKVLDIAAGHGMFGLSIARMNPNAQIVALDWPNVLAVAEENAKKFGVADRWSKKAGSAFEADYGEGYDYILLTNILHHFDHAGNVTLMKRVHAALKPGGKAITLEFVPNPDRVSPPVPAAFSMVMLANTDAATPTPSRSSTKFSARRAFPGRSRIQSRKCRKPFWYQRNSRAALLRCASFWKQMPARRRKRLVSS